MPVPDSAIAVSVLIFYDTVSLLWRALIFPVLFELPCMLFMEVKVERKG